MDAEKQLRALTHVDAETDRILRTLGPLPQRDAASAKGKIETLFLDRRGLLENLESSYRRYVKDLQTLEFTEQQLVSELANMRTFWTLIFFGFAARASFGGLTSPISQKRCSGP